MAANKILRFGPAYLSNAAADVVNPKITSLAGVTGFTLTQPYVILRHVRITNKTGGAVTFSLYVGATGGSAGGTEVIGNALSVPANSAYDWYGQLRLDSGDYLSGLASAATSLVFEAEGEIGIS